MGLSFDTSNDGSLESAYSKDANKKIPITCQNVKESLARRLNFNLEDDGGIHKDMQVSVKGKEIMVEINDVPHFSEENHEIKDVSIGKGFESEQQAYDFYNEYARKVGFSIRKAKVERTRKGVIRVQHFECSNGGYRQKHRRDINVKKKCAETRTGCMARMVIKFEEDIGLWVVNECECTHNHPLVTPSKVFLLRSQRKVKRTQAAKILTMHHSGVHLHKAMSAFVKKLEGMNVGFTVVDYKKILRTTCMKELREGDVQAVLDYLKKMQLDNPSFFYAVQVDREDKMTNFFWANARSVIDYSYFSDVVCFDATYQTNKYGRPFSPSVGVNHHRQTIIFGAALLLDEATESFVWLFHTFLKAMSGHALKTILTDQNAAMANAISIVLPKTCHRLCLWHIYQNAAKHLSTRYTKGFKKKFKHVIYSPETEEIFFEYGVNY